MSCALGLWLRGNCGCVLFVLNISSPFRLRSFCAFDFPFRGNFFGGFASWVFFFFPPFRGAGEEGGSRGAPSVVVGCFLPSRSTLVWRGGGGGVPLGICLSRADSLLLLLLLREVGTRELALLLRTPFPRFS